MIHFCFSASGPVVLRGFALDNIFLNNQKLYIISYLFVSDKQLGISMLLRCSMETMSIESCLLFQLASRSLRQQVEPVIMLKLHVEDGDQKEVKLLQTDPTNLLHLTRTLEEALQELNSAHSRRISRNFWWHGIIMGLADQWEITCPVFILAYATEHCWSFVNNIIRLY